MVACELMEIIFFPLFTTCEITSGVSHLILNFLEREGRTVIYQSASKEEPINVQGTGKHKVQGKAKWIVFCSNLKGEKEYHRIIES